MDVTRRAFYSCFLHVSRNVPLRILRNRYLLKFQETSSYNRWDTHTHHYSAHLGSEQKKKVCVESLRHLRHPVQKGKNGSVHLEPPLLMRVSSAMVALNALNALAPSVGWKCRKTMALYGLASNARRLCLCYFNLVYHRKMLRLPIFH